jgi:stress-induced morphogen
MMIALEDRATPETARIVRLLEAHFPHHPAAYPAAAYRYNSASIRVRVVDDSFRGLDLLDREEKVRPLLRKLPQGTRSDITILLLLTPEEVEDSWGNREFENPSPPPVRDD